MASFIVPPGGFAGFSQMTPASRASLFPRGRATTGRRKRRSKKNGGSGSRKRMRSSKRTSRKRKGPKFGSPAFQKLHKVGKYAKKR